jgi:PEGA domain
MNRIIVWITVVLMSVGAPAFAQPAPTPEEVQQAQARWGEGKAFFDAGNYEAARVAFKQAYTVFPHPAFLQNLGEAELRCGRQVDAARHLSQFIRTATAGTTAQRDAAKKSLKKATEKLGSVIVETNAEDAEVHVDDDVIGRSPLGSMQWFVEPGAHSVIARKEGYLDGIEKIDVAIGPPKNVFVKLQRVVGSVADDASPQAAANVAKPEPASAGQIEPPVGSAPDTKKGPVMQPRTLVLIGGAVLTVGAFGLAGFFATEVGSDLSEQSAAQQNLVPVAGVVPEKWCAGTLTLSAKAACDHLAVTGVRVRRDQMARNGLLIAGGVLGVATVATYFLWPARPNRSPAVALDLGPDRRGVMVYGQF